MPHPEEEPSILIKFDNRPGGGGGPQHAKEMRESKVVDVDGAPVPVRVGETLTPLHDEAHRCGPKHTAPGPAKRPAGYDDFS